MKEYKTFAHAYAELIKIINYIHFLVLWTIDYKEILIPFDIVMSAFVRHKVTTSLSTVFTGTLVSLFF